ncbi:MAG: SAM-dependent methyltransferase [Desulfobacterales bacterium]|nr:MAG: SAM-dependent methyltransferase [Desulfobacterales bacterium]
MRQLLPPVGAEGLEIGVGSGKFAAPLGIKIGVEPSENMAIKARKLGINVYPGIAEDLPFPDGEFDFVLMVTTICFVDDVAKSFSEAFRVLKSGGCIVIGFMDKESKLGKMYAEKRGKSKFYQEATFFSTQEILKYLEDTGFRPSRIKQTIISGRSPKIILDNFGKGSFVVIRGEK